MKKLRLLAVKSACFAVTTAFIFGSGLASAAVIYDESTDGDLTFSSAGGGSPPILNLGLGLNQVIGIVEVTAENRDFVGEADAFQFQLPSNAILSSVSVTYTFEFLNGGLLLGLGHFLLPDPPSSGNQVQTNVSSFTALFGTETLFPGALPSVPGGLHEIYMSPNNVSSTAGIGTLRYFYTIDLVAIQTVPIPPALWLFGSGLLGLIGIARKKAA